MTDVYKCKNCKWKGRDTIMMTKTVDGSRLRAAHYCPNCHSEINDGQDI